jgi:chromosome segregation protein
MDAVRWVLGESRASELRGESMQDVIFNGSTTRKPAGRASVELIFNNADHRAGGQWNAFEEIAVKRILTRSGHSTHAGGTSSYLINNQVVRRRDVQDVFLGTGLGPRAYAIIGQGTISRIIESKPEELRLFLEEAAGVSKYKERRRETENRLTDTRENLTRVDDILRELTANLEKLEKQAEIAQRYQGLQSEVTLKQHQQWFLKRAEAQADQAKVRADAEAAINALEEQTAKLRHIEADLETVRQAHYTAGDELNQSQRLLYEANADIGRLEAEIRYVVEGRKRVEQRLVTLQDQIQQWATRKEDAELELERLAELAVVGDEQAELLAAQVEEQAEQLPELDDVVNQAQSAANTQRNAVVQVQQQIQVLGAEQRGMETQIRQLNQRHERLNTERKALVMPDAGRLEELEFQLEEAQESAVIADARLQELQELLPQRDEARRVQQKAVNHESAQQADWAARLSALKALQEKVKTNGKLQPWLKKHGLDALAVLWSRIHIKAGWETALEAALRERLGALEVSRLEMLRAFANDPPPGKLVFFDAPKNVAATALSTGVTSHFPSLFQYLQIPDDGLKAILQHWLHGCFTAKRLEDALAARDQLEEGQAIYLPSGHVVTRHSVGFFAQDSEQSGLLARAQEIDNLDKELRAQILLTDQARADLVRTENAYAQVAQDVVAARRDATQTQSAAHSLQVEYMRLHQAVEQAQHRSSQMEADWHEIQTQLDDLQERRIEAEGRFEMLDRELADAQQRHAELEDSVITAQTLLTQCRDQQRRLERQAQEAAFTQRSLQARSAELARTVDTAAQQSQAVHAEMQRAQDELHRLSDAAAQAGLQNALTEQLEREKALADQRNAHEALGAQLRQYEAQRTELERALEPLRQRITDFQLKEQAARLGFEQYELQLTEDKADLARIEQSIQEGDVRLQGIQAEIDRLQRAIIGLGAVNLAALEELAVARERKDFLDAQNADLTQAMQTLEDAIRKIDAETRDMLLGTFNQVNEHFGRMFPELFGGGNAKLMMVGEEILHSGIQVIAQPPGKKNQTIHLLSGGEKALTAIALVFAIFQLNPAPFCLLDEVDAPLDDANTERYAKLVRSMSAETQFLFISHNKIAMEMAEQLIGVTMQEQGVSRIVTVDMEAAISLVKN